MSTLIHLRANLPERPTYALWGTPYGGVTAVTLVWVNAEVLYVGLLIKKYILTPLCERREEEPDRDRSDGNPHGNYGVLPAG